jgi:hypothetical protein
MAARDCHSPHDAIPDSHRFASGAQEAAIQILDHADRLVAQYAGCSFAAAAGDRV